MALASDVNPGGGLSPSLPFAMALACFGMGLSLEEALSRGDRQRGLLARPLGRDRLDRDRASARTSCCCARARLLDLVRVGVPAIRSVVKDGRVVVRDGRLVAPLPRRRA